MVSEFNKTMTKDSVIASPKDEILNGVVLKIEKGLLGEFLDDKVKDKFDNLEQPTLFFYIECKFNNKHIRTTDRLAFYEEPMSNSKLGKYLEKYGELKAGQEIKVIFNDKGFGSIKLD